MSRWFAVGEPLLIVKASRIRFKRKPERLRNLAKGHAIRTLGSYGYERSISGYYEDAVNSRTAILLAERRAVREAVFRALGNAPHWRRYRRRGLTIALCNRSQIDKWW